MSLIANFLLPNKHYKSLIGIKGSILLSSSFTASSSMTELLCLENEIAWVRIRKVGTFSSRVLASLVTILMATFSTLSSKLVNTFETSMSTRKSSLRLLAEPFLPVFLAFFWDVWLPLFYAISVKINKRLSEIRVFQKMCDASENITAHSKLTLTEAFSLKLKVYLYVLDHDLNLSTAYVD